MKEYQKEYHRIWEEIVETDGELDLDKVMRELYDFSNLIESSSKVYCHVTRGLISKPTTTAEVIIRVFDEQRDLDIQEAIREEKLDD